MKNHLIVSSLLATLLTLGLSAEDTGKQEKKWYEVINVSGFVDVFYNSVDNNKSGKKEDNSAPFHTYNKQFGVNAVELDLEKVAEKESPWGFRIDFMNGQNSPYQEGAFTGKNQMYNMNLLQQAYVSFFFPVLKGLTVDVGKMATHIGTEVLESKDNYNYNIGYIFFNTVPFIHTGARANLQLTEDWSFALYVYNSAAGTSYQNPTTYLASSEQHAYTNSETSMKAYGTQIKGNLMKDKLDVVWNTLYGSDLQLGRLSNKTVYLNDIMGNTNIPAEQANPKKDYWFVSHLLFVMTPMDKLSLMADWTFGEKSGSSAANAKDGIAPAGPGEIRIGRDGDGVKNIYNTYGLWLKYDFTDKFALAMRYENIDDSRYGGVLGNQPLGGYTPTGRTDLSYLDSKSLRKSANLGMVRTFTITPTYTWSENVIVKLDLRRDWAQGEQFVNSKGQPSGYQNSATLGLVAKF